MDGLSDWESAGADGTTICLLNVLDLSTGSRQRIEGEVWVSIVCGDKTEPVDLPPLSPLPNPVRTLLPDEG